MSKHTPGPWTRGFKDDQTIYAEYKRVAAVQCGERQWEANARLIAAAPDLLAALIDLQKQLREHVKLDVKKHYSLMVADAAANNAIAKVEG